MNTKPIVKSDLRQILDDLIDADGSLYADSMDKAVTEAMKKIYRKLGYKWSDKEISR